MSRKTQWPMPVWSRELMSFARSKLSDLATTEILRTRLTLKRKQGLLLVLSLPVDLTTGNERVALDASRVLSKKPALSQSQQSRYTTQKRKKCEMGAVRF